MLDADLRLIVENSFCFTDLLLYAPVNSYGHVGALDVERDVEHYMFFKQTRITFRNKTQVYVKGCLLMCDEALRRDKVKVVSNMKTVCLCTRVDTFYVN